LLLRLVLLVLLVLAGGVCQVRLMPASHPCSDLAVDPRL
jgi:hypothetical protein